MKNKLFFLSLFFTIIVQVNPFAQSVTLEDSIKQPSLPNLEKVYLHTDRNYYAIGDDLWYKAYSTYAYNHVPFDHSKTLYVELISPESKIIQRNITRLDKGLGHGDFKLVDSIGVKAGTYQLRAYTNWMRNFDRDFVFKKNIEVLDISDRDGKANEKRKERKNNGKESKLNLQFFPEGGALVEGVPSTVGFKALDGKGRPIDVEGNIFVSDGPQVTSFKSIHDGMGKFVYTPHPNQTYYAELSDANGDIIRAPLPEALKTGYTLSIVQRNDKCLATIKTNLETLKLYPEQTFSVICRTRGITYFEGNQLVNSETTSFLIPTKGLPEGITQVTIYDESSKPHSERLLFIDRGKGVNVVITKDKEWYKPKEKVQLGVEAHYTNSEPVSASFSFSAVDLKAFGGNSRGNSNICSFFLMESDIRGKINNPGYYFNHANKDRFYKLDLLLLTQGWRDFLWKKIPKKREGSNYKLEEGLKISGKVTSVLLGKERENVGVSLLLSKNDKLIRDSDTTDVNGRFSFDNLFFKGNVRMLLNTKNHKEKNRGHIQLDTLIEKPLSSSFKGGSSLYIKTQGDQVKEQIYKNHIDFNVPIENVLDEIVITGKKKDETQSMYGTADHTFIANDVGFTSGTIYNYLEYNVPGLNASASGVRFFRNIGAFGGGNAYILVDGVEFTAAELDFLAPEDIAKIESFKTSSAALFGTNGGNGAILIYTKEGSGNRKNKDFHTLVKNVKGYQETRIFYVPNYGDSKDLNADEPDIRNTLYWNPYVHPDKNGRANLFYYNSEVSTDVLLTLEGITTTGIPIVVKDVYKVE